MAAEFNEQDILAAVNSEVEGLSPEQLKEELLKFRIRQKTQQKKNYGSGNQKAYQAKQRAKQNALKEMAKKLGLWDAIEKEADEKAEEAIAATQVDSEDAE
jgi:hypothetical protein